MNKTQTEVNVLNRGIRITKGDKVLILGSCFAASMAEPIAEMGCDVLLNPFGTLFNPFSISSSLRRMVSAENFTEDECVQLGAGSDLWCSFSHYTRFAKETREEFLSNANSRLADAAAFLKGCNKIIITFGTAWVFRYTADDVAPMKGKIVSNCLKRPAKEFCRTMTGVDEIAQDWSALLKEDIFRGKEIIFTVSPIRHMADGAHGNALSKSTLLLAVDRITRECPVMAEYFPAYEILLDELRDYSWYAEDLVHPSAGAVEIIRKKFLESL